MTRNLRLVAMILALFMGRAVAVQAADIVRIPGPVSAQDLRRDYSKALLVEVLRRTESSHGRYELVEFAGAMNRPRLLLEMREGARVNVVANPADAQWLRELTVVWVPIDMGLQRWRISLIRRSLQAELDRVRSLAEFKAFRFGVASGWVTRSALEASGFETIVGGNYDGLFGMLLAQRFDLLPRGVNEVFHEFDQRKAQSEELAVEQRFLLHDQIPVLFFVSPSAPRLAVRLTAGLEAMLKDGSLRRFLLSYFGDTLSRARLCERTIVEIPSPPLPRELVGRSELWIDPFIAQRKIGCRAPAERMLED